MGGFGRGPATCSLLMVHKHDAHSNDDNGEYDDAGGDCCADDDDRNDDTYLLPEQDKRQRDIEVKRAIQHKGGRFKADTAEFVEWGKNEHEIYIDHEQVIHSFV